MVGGGVLWRNASGASQVSTRGVGDHQVELSARPGPWGFNVEMRVDFPEDRAITSGVFRLGDRTVADVGYYVNDGTDSHWPPPMPLPLDEGVSVTVSASLPVDCTKPAQRPVLVIRSRTDEAPASVDRFVVSNSGDYAAAVTTWCTMGVQGTVASSSASASADGDTGFHGDVTVNLQLVNPGSTPVRVTSEAYDAGDSHWNSAAVTVAPRGKARLTITATGAYCGIPDTPWKTGNLRADGRPLRLHEPDQWC